MLFTAPLPLSGAFAGDLQEEPVVLTAVVNGERIGDFFLMLTTDYDVLMKQADFPRTRISQASPSVLTVSGDTYVSLRSIQGLSFA